MATQLRRMHMGYDLGLDLLSVIAPDVQPLVPPDEPPLVALTLTDPDTGDRDVVVLDSRARQALLTLVKEGEALAAAAAATTPKLIVPS